MNTRTQSCLWRAGAYVLIAALAIFVCGVSQAQTPPGEIKLSTTSSDGMLTPTLTWSTTAENCVASGDAEWEGPKPSSGTQTLSPAPTTQPRAFALVCSTAGDSQALLAWTPPTQNTDGTPLTNLAGYRVLYGTAPTSLSQTVDLPNPSLSAYTIDGLAPGAWYFGLRAYTTQGAESGLSNIVSKTTRASVEWSAQTVVKVPKAPVMSEPGGAAD